MVLNDRPVGVFSLCLPIKTSMWNNMDVVNTNKKHVSKYLRRALARVEVGVHVARHALVRL